MKTEDLGKKNSSAWFKKNEEYRSQLTGHQIRPFAAPVLLSAKFSQFAGRTAAAIHLVGNPNC